MTAAPALATTTPASLDPWLDILRPLLTALRWRGQERHIVEALSARPLPLSLAGFREVMADLGYASRQHRARRRVRPPFPALSIDRDGRPHLVTHADMPADSSGKLLTFEALAADQIPPDPASSAWLPYLIRFRPLLLQIMLYSLFIGLMALVPAFYNKAIYDEVIGAGSDASLNMLFAGAMLALAGEVALRVARSRQQSRLGARMDHYVSCSVFDHLMHLPPSFTERAPIASQIARLRDFESVREFFTGPLASMFFELPLVALYLAAAAIIGGWLVAIPFLLVLVYILLLWLMLPVIRRRSRVASVAASAKQAFLLETLGKLQALRRDGMDHVWQQRFQRLSADTASSSFRAATAAQGLEVSSYILMTLGGIATLTFGVALIVNGLLTTGALIATVMLTWRILSPLQLCCASAARLQQLSASVEQIQRLTSIPTERAPRALPPIMAPLKGAVAYRRVSLKYGPDASPAWFGIQLDIAPGQVIAITGPNGSGKSSLLKLILGLAQPQSGAVLLDGMDIRQFDPLILRQRASYIPQHPTLLPGTLRDNMLLAQPDATGEDLRRTLGMVDALASIDALPQGLDTLVAGDGARPLGVLLEHRIHLACCALRAARVALIDEMPPLPTGTGSDSLVAAINAWRGKATILLVTRREDIMRMADQLIVLAEGEVTHAGAPARVLQALQEGKK